MRAGLAVGLAVLAGACSVPSAPSGVLPAGGERVMRFGEARAVASDGAGRLYVVDAAASEVIVLDARGAVLDRLGGTEDQAFLDLTDVDPTNGQAVFVADAGTGRIVRFTAEGRPAESIRVPRTLDIETAARAGEDAGRPIAVAAGPGNTLYAIEAERGVVLRWDADRQLDRVLGGPASPTPLRDPTALAVTDDGTLLVADGGRVVAFDAFGAVTEAPQADSAGDVVTVVVADGFELAIRPGSIRLLDGGDELAVDLGEDIVDATVAGPWLYWVTRTQLVRMPLTSLRQLESP